MKLIVLKYLLTSLLVVMVSEAARSGNRWAALLAAMPFVATLALIWMHYEDVPETRMAGFAFDTFWYVLPSVPMFLVFATTLPRFGFWPALTLAAASTLTLFLVMAKILAIRGHTLY